MHKCTQPITITIQMHQTCIQPIEFTHTTSKCAFKHLQASKHLLMPQMRTNAPPSRSTSKAPPNTKTFQDPFYNQQAIKPLTLTFTTS